MAAVWMRVLPEGVVYSGAAPGVTLAAGARALWAILMPVAAVE